MASFAIVIGIDAYDNPAWNLAGAVDDALRFVDWATGPGDVPPANLRLLLSTARANPTGLPYAPANRRDITQALFDFQNGAGQGGDRLYVYYAGHGVSAPGASAGAGPAEPSIIPADVKSLELDAPLLIGFSGIMPLLARVPPLEQFFFIDACRDFAIENYRPAIGGGSSRWLPPAPGAGPRSAQYVLYATAPGQRAFETGRGIFAAALMDGLGGQPAASVWTPAEGSYQVRFSTLTRFVRERIRREIRRLAREDWERYLQVPEPELQGGGGETDPTLVRIARDRVARVSLVVRVGPSAARKVCRLEAREYLQGGQREVVALADGPPVGLPINFDLLPGDYTLVAVGDTYEEARQPCHLYEPASLDLALKPSSGRASAPASTAQTGRLSVTADDPRLLIVVRDGQANVVATGTGAVSQDLVPGIYHIQPVLPEGAGPSRSVEVQAGARVPVSLEAPAPAMGRQQMEMLAALEIKPTSDGYLHPSELLGGIANARVASLLGFAAFAAHWPQGDFVRLRSFGVRPVSAPPGASGLLVLVGASGDRPLPGVTREAFVAGGEVLVRNRSDAIVHRAGFEPLAGFPAAAQLGAVLPVGPVELELSLPGLAPTSYALVGLPDRVSVLVVVAEDRGTFDVQQYLLPLRPHPLIPSGYTQGRPDDVRRLETAQRYYASGHDLPEGDLVDLLYGKWLDPLLGCLAGYALVRRGRQADYVGHSSWPASPPNDPEPSAMRNMLRFFPELPDSHVLAGLCEPERRQEHYAEAVRRGRPVFAEGFRALEQWQEQQPTGVPADFAGPAAGLLSGSPWTAWTVARPALLVEGGRFGTAPPGWEILEAERAAIERVCRSVGRIELSGHSVLDWIGTGFLVGPDVVLTASHVAQQFCQREGRRRWRLQPGLSARIDFAEELGPAQPAEFDVVDVIAVDERRRVALLKIAPTSSQGVAPPPPLAIAAAAPQPIARRKIYVVGYPARDTRADPAVTSRVFAEVYGFKRLQPGEMVALDEGGAIFHHDCFTLGGNAGSCVVDLATHRVLGLHYAGRHRGEGVKYNDAVALWPLVDSTLLRKASARFE